MTASDRITGLRALFDLVADEYDAVDIPFFVPIAEHLVEAVRPMPGERAVDLGCGRGAVTEPLADAVAPGGRVTALDLSPAMAAHTRAALSGHPVPVDVLVGDASDPELAPGTFDLVVSSLVLFFLPEPEAALTRWVRLLAPGGRIGLTTFGPVAPNWRTLEAPIVALMPPGDPRTAGAASPFSSDAGMERLFEAAGVVDVATATRRIDLAFDDFDHWLRFSRSSGQRATWERLSPAETDDVLGRSRQIFDSLAEPDGRFLAWQDVRYTTGRAAPEAT